MHEFGLRKCVWFRGIGPGGAPVLDAAAGGDVRIRRPGRVRPHRAVMEQLPAARQRRGDRAHRQRLQAQRALRGRGDTLGRDALEAGGGGEGLGHALVLHDVLVLQARLVDQPGAATKQRSIFFENRS